jgi:hypothetical protein
VLEADVAMTSPNAWGDKPLAKRNGHKGMLLGSWLNRALRGGHAGLSGGRRGEGVTVNASMPRF